MSTRLDELNTTRLRVWNEAQALLDDVSREHRELSGEESAQWDRYNKRLDQLDAEIRRTIELDDNERIAGEIREANVGAFGKTRDNVAGEADLLRRFIRGEVGPITIPLESARRERQLIRDGATGMEARALAWDTGSIASAVPTTMARALYEYLEAETAVLRMPVTHIVTQTGENREFPKVGAHAIATQVSGQGTTLAGTDPTFDKLTLGAFKYGELVIVSNEVMEDTSFSMAEYLGRDLGRAVGRKVGTDLVTGNGSTQPQGVMTAAAVAGMGSVTTGGSLLTPDYEDLINLQYSLNDAYRNRTSCGWLLKDSTAGTLRKLREDAGGTTGAPLWQPSMIAGQPDTLLGFRAWTDPNVAAQGSNARIIAFADWNGYILRTVGDVVVEVDRSRYFDTDQTGVRAKLRVDGGLIDNDSLKSLVMNV
jgi:HK97 family phage major capsid protein